MKKHRKSKKQTVVSARVALTKEQVCFLDKLIDEIRFKSRRKLSRSKIVQALFRGTKNLKIDVKGVRSEKELMDRFLASYKQE